MVQTRIQDVEKSCHQADDILTVVILSPGSRGGQRVLDVRSAAGRTGGGTELPVLPWSGAGGQSEESETEPEARRRPDEVQGQTQL